MELVSAIEARIAPFLPQEKGFQQTVLDAMEYSVFAGGKRLRPMLMEASYQMFDGTNPAIDDFMAAIEMIHTYSLIHDDLPAMDNDEYRRGKKTTHAVYGEAMAILAGDALLNYAFETVAAALTRNEGDWRIVRAFSVLAQKAGIYGMIGGQVVDVESEKTGQTIDRNRLDFIYRLKTGALIEASLIIGGGRVPALYRTGIRRMDGGWFRELQRSTMNTSGLLILNMEKKALILGISEGVIVFALAVLFHYGIEMGSQISGRSMRTDEGRRGNDGWNGLRAGSCVCRGS